MEKVICLGRHGWNGLRRCEQWLSLTLGVNPVVVCSWVPQDIQSWVIFSRWWSSFQPLYLGQVALPQAFSISKPWSFIPKPKSSLFQYCMRQRSSCTVSHCHRATHYHNSSQMARLCLYYWNCHSYHRSAEISQPKLALDRRMIKCILHLQRFPSKTSGQTKRNKEAGA